MSETFVLFQVAGATYAVRSEHVQMVDMVGVISPVPRAPDFIEGVMASRGKIIPVVSMRRRFHLPEDKSEEQAAKRRARILVIRVEGRTIGMRVDSAREFLRIEQDQIQPPPDDLRKPGNEYLEGVIALPNRVILIINLARLFDPVERRELAEHDRQTEA